MQADTAKMSKEKKMTIIIDDEEVAKEKMLAEKEEGLVMDLISKKQRGQKKKYCFVCENVYEAKFVERRMDKSMCVVFPYICTFVHFHRNANAKFRKLMLMLWEGGRGGGTTGMCVASDFQNTS